MGSSTNVTCEAWLVSLLQCLTINTTRMLGPVFLERILWESVVVQPLRTVRAATSILRHILSLSEGTSIFRDQRVATSIPGGHGSRFVSQALTRQGNSFRRFSGQSTADVGTNSITYER